MIQLKVRRLIFLDDRAASSAQTTASGNSSQLYKQRVGATSIH